jgi:hypothetical protein
MDNVQKHNDCNSIILTSENTYLALHPSRAYTFLVCYLLSSPLFDGRGARAGFLALPLYIHTYSYIHTYIIAIMIIIFKDCILLRIYNERIQLLQSTKQQRKFIYLYSTTCFDH